MRFRKEKHEFTFRVQCENCGAGFKDRKHDYNHNC